MRDQSLIDLGQNARPVIRLTITVVGEVTDGCFSWSGAVVEENLLKKGGAVVPDLHEQAIDEADSLVHDYRRR